METISTYTGASFCLLLLLNAQGLLGQTCLNPPIFYCTPGIMQMPLAVPRYFTLTTQLPGTWYEYMILNPPFSYTNLVMYFSPIGNVLSAMFAGSDSNPNRTLMGIFFNVTVTMYKLPNKTCAGNFIEGFAGNDGRIQNLAYLPASGAVRPVAMYYELLFSDYTNVTIYSLCAKMNLATNMCDRAIISVLTKTPPNQLSEDAKTYVKSVVDSTMKPYCLSAVNFQLSAWDDYLPTCIVHPPDEMIALIQTLNQLNQ